MRRLTLLVLVVLALLLAPSTIAPAASKTYVHSRVLDELREQGKARVIVVMWSSDLPAVRAKDWRQRGPAIRRLAARVRADAPRFRVLLTYETQPFLAGIADIEALRQLRESPAVEGVYPVHRVEAVLRESGPLIGQPEAELAGYDGRGITVAVLDSGVDYTNAMLGGGALVPFTDVKPGFWAWRYVETIAIAGVAQGFADGTYKPGLTVTRDQMATYVARALAGGDASVPTPGQTPRFPDVPTTFWAYRYIQYISDPSLDIVKGFSDGTYQPLLPVDRGTMAAYIARSLAQGGDAFFATYSPPDPGFPDVTPNLSFYKYVAYLKANGIVAGFTDGLYHPESTVTRDQMAKFIAIAFHLAFPGAVVGGANFVQLPGTAGVLDPMDDFGHGTWVSGIIASRDSVWRGIAPVSTLAAVKVLDNTGSGSSDVVTAGVDWCIQHRQDFNIKVINMSLSSTTPFSDPAECDTFPEAQALADAMANGILVVAAAGNDSFTSGIGFPACASAATAVGATGDGGPAPSGQQPVPADAIANFSDAGELLSLFAPGIWITGSGLGGGLVTGAGTSASAPHVAGAAADIMSKGIADAAGTKQLLMRTGKQIIDSRTGVATPRVDLIAAINPPTNLADLIVTAVSGPANALTGDAANVSITVKNQGTQSSAACTAIVVLSTNRVISPQDSVVATVQVPSLSPGASHTIAAAGVIPALIAGTYWLGGYADSQYVVPELDETNNLRIGNQATIQVAAPSGFP